MEWAATVRKVLKKKREVLMEKVIRYRCGYCGDLFYTEEECLKHEQRHLDVEKANQMLENGATLQKINDTCHIWHKIPEHLKEVTTDNCFVISYWQCCNKPAYRIYSIDMDGRLRVGGCGSWSGYYGESLTINNSSLKNVHNKEELFVDSRSKTRF